MSKLSLEPIETPFGRVLTILLDGKPAWKLECPVCGEWAYLDEDQLFGRVSVDHTDTGCLYHETHDFAAALNRKGPRMGDKRR